MLTVEQQLEELTAKVDQLSTRVDLANNSVASLMKTVSKITDSVGFIDRWSKDADKFANDLEAALRDLTLRVQALEQPPKSAPPHASLCEEGGGPMATAMPRVTRVCMWGILLTPPWSRVSHPVLKAKLNALITCALGSSYTHA
jgi:hypothetical protein